MLNSVDITSISKEHHAADVPKAFAAHELVRDRLFYTVPRALLDAVVRWATPAALDPGLLPLEQVLGDVCDGHDAQIGFWNGRPVGYPNLNAAPTMTKIAAALPANWQQDPAWQHLAWMKNSATMADIDKLTSWNDCAARGYCGWLVTNLQFVREHDEFFMTWRETIRLRASMPYNDQRAQWVANELKPCLDSYLALCGRWQLAGLAGPYLPLPLGPQLPVTDLSLMPLAALAGGTLLYLPNTHPLPDRATLRKMIDDALARHRAPDHLKEWSDLVDAAHTGKSTIARYGRLFQLQHHWRVLHRRHGPFLHGHRENVVKAMVAVLFLGVDDADDKKFESVRKDMTFISERLGGSDWYRRPSALDHF